jgi:hypothetical protein
MYTRIGHIEIEIPWSQLGRKAVVVKVEGVHVLAYAKYQVGRSSDGLIGWLFK